MKYVNEEIRRQDRVLNEEQALDLLAQTEYGIVSMIDENGLPYGIPVNHVWDKKNSIYIHCAPEGKKLRAIKHHPNVSFCVVGRTNVLPKYFTTEYESAVFFGTARAQLDEEEKMKALHLLIDKLSPEFKELGDTYAHKSFNRVEIIRIDIESFSGKAKTAKQVRKSY